MSRDRVWDVVTFSVLGLGFVALGVWLLRPRATLEGADALLERGQYEALESLALGYLAEHPGDERARLLAARAAVKRAEPRPERALRQLEGLRPRGRAAAAEAKSLAAEAYFLEERFDRAEAAWREALALDPRVPEAGWGLLNLYALQGRFDESRALGLKLFRVEPDPHDRVQLLLQLIRHDAHAISPDTIARQLESVVSANPADIPSSLAYGLALVHDSRFDDGLAVLQRVVKQAPDRPEVWEAYLNGLADAGRIDELTRELERVPASFRDDPRFAAARGWAASQRDDWPKAVSEFTRAWRARPGDASIAYRLQQALRAAGRPEELARLEDEFAAVAAARTRIRELWDEIDALPGLGHAGYPVQFNQVADVLELFDREEEAAAWRSLARQQLAAPPGAPVTAPEGNPGAAATGPSAGPP